MCTISKEFWHQGCSKWLPHLFLLWECMFFSLPVYTLYFYFDVVNNEKKRAFLIQITFHWNCENRGLWRPCPLIWPVRFRLTIGLAVNPSYSCSSIILNDKQCQFDQNLIKPIATAIQLVRLALLYFKVGWGHSLLANWSRMLTLINNLHTGCSGIGNCWNSWLHIGLISNMHFF